jgi:hypothetical protein
VLNVKKRTKFSPAALERIYTDLDEDGKDVPLDDG